MKVAKNLFCFVLFALLLNCALIENVSAEQPRPISLSAIVFFGHPSVRELKHDNNLKKANACLRKYLDAIPPKSYLLLPDISSGPEDAVNYKRRNLEEQIVTVLGENTRVEAKAFSQAVPLYAEWEGMSEGPVDEANFVDNWLSKRPGTPIAPFLHLFKAHRLRAGYEAARAGHEKGLWPVLARQYRESLDKVRFSTNPLISCIIKDLEAQTYVYLEGYGRP
jgi:hypothetical protein